MANTEAQMDAPEMNGSTEESEVAGQPEVPPRASELASRQPGGASIAVDDSQVSASYANFCRVSSTPEELILDLGLNPQPFATSDVTIKVGQRVILNHFTAKRLLSALSMALQRHEQAFGVLETDVRRRVQSR